MIFFKEKITKTKGKRLGVAHLERANAYLKRNAIGVDDILSLPPVVVKQFQMTCYLVFKVRKT
jgi:hypothetical protein